MSIYTKESNYIIINGAYMSMQRSTDGIKCGYFMKVGDQYEL